MSMLEILSTISGVECADNAYLILYLPQNLRLGHF